MTTEKSKIVKTVEEFQNIYEMPRYDEGKCIFWVLDARKGREWGCIKNFRGKRKGNVPNSVSLIHIWTHLEECIRIVGHKIGCCDEGKNRKEERHTTVSLKFYCRVWKLYSWQNIRCVQRQCGQCNAEFSLGLFHGYFETFFPAS